MATAPNDSLTVVEFKMLPVLNDGKTMKEKRPIYDDMEVCVIKFAANKQTVGVFPANESLGWIDGPDGTRTEQTYAMKYNAQYLAFKDGAAQSQMGTPLELAPFLTPGKRLELKALNIWTIEALASLDGAPLKRLGMGGRELQREATVFLAEQPGASSDALVEVVSRQDDQIAILMQQIADMQAQLASQTLANNAPAEPAKDAEPAKAADPLDHDANGKKGGAKRATKAKAEPDAEPAKPSPFADFENVDILNWLKDNDPADELVAKWPIVEDDDGVMTTNRELSADDRAELLAHADEIAAKLSKKAN
jgi:hypothetical protein